MGQKNGKRPAKATPYVHRHEYLDEAFLRYLARYLPGIKRQPKEVQLALCGMIYETQSRHRAHSLHEGYSRFTWQELEHLFGRGGFKSINDGLGIFEVIQDWSKVEGRTKPYKLTEKVSTIRENYLNGWRRRGATRLLTPDGKYLESLPASAMRAKNKDGQNRRGFQGLPVTPLVPVNLVQVKKLIIDIEVRLLAHGSGFVQSEIFSGVPDIKFLRDLKQNAAMIYSKAQNVRWPGYVVHRYSEMESGRVYVDGPTNLQNCYRPLREAAMAGLYDVDIENCHYSILAQMAATHGYQCVEVQDYLANKDKVRESFAAEFGISVRQVKDALIALIYGAKFSLRAKDALAKIFKTTQLAKKIYEHPKFLALRNDIAAARGIVLKAQEVTRCTIRNCRGLTIRLDESNPRQQLAHLLQGVEVTALEAAYWLYPTEIVLLQHDGFTSTAPLNIERIEAAMMKATGYKLQVKQKVIQINLSDPFNAHLDDANNQIETDLEANADAGSELLLAS